MSVPPAGPAPRQRSSRAWIPVWLIIYFSSPAVIAFPLKAVWLYAAFGVGMVGLALKEENIVRWRLDRVLLVMVTGALFLTAADLLMRPMVDSRISGRPEDFLMHRWSSMPSQTRFTPNYHYEGRVVGDLVGVSGDLSAAEPRTIAFTTDAHGFRNLPGSENEVVDLIALGDSFGAGFGVSQEKTWSSRLAAEGGFNVYNLSTGGSPWNEWMNVRTELDRLKLGREPRLVWMIFTGNDLGSVYGPVEPRFAGPLERAWTRWSVFRNRSPLLRMFNKARYALRVDREPSADIVRGLDPEGRPVLFLRSFLDEELRSLGSVMAHPNYKGLSDVFGAMAALTAERGIRVLVVSVPTKEGVYAEWMESGIGATGPADSPSGLSLAVQRLARVHGFGFVDLKPRMREGAGKSAEAGESAGTAERTRVLWWRDDTHWNDEGHAVAAEEILRHLRADRRASGTS